MAEHRDLDLRLGPNAIVRPKQVKDAAQDEVEDGSNHGAALSQIRWCRARIGRQSGLFTPRLRVPAAGRCSTISFGPGHRRPHGHCPRARTRWLGRVPSVFPPDDHGRTRFQRGRAAKTRMSPARIPIRRRGRVISRPRSIPTTLRLDRGRRPLRQPGPDTPAHTVGRAIPLFSLWARPDQQERSRTRRDGPPRHNRATWLRPLKARQGAPGQDGYVGPI